MRRRAMTVVLAALVVADLLSSGLCCPLTRAAVAAPDECCTAAAATPLIETLESPDTAGQPDCGRGCYEASGGAVPRQGTGSTAGHHGAIVCSWVTADVVDEHQSPCPRYSLLPPTSDGGHLAPTPRGPPVS